MSLWELAACMDGYARAHGVSTKREGEGMSEERMRDIGIEGIV